MRKRGTFTRRKDRVKNCNKQILSKINDIVVSKFTSKKLRLLDIDRKEGHVCLSCEPVGSFACCPECSRKSRSVHKYRTRKLSALEFISEPCTLLVHVRHFYCNNPGCPRKTFSEPLAAADRYGRMCREVQERVRYESLNQPSRKAVETLSLQHISVSSSTCLRIARKQGERNPESISCSGHVGIDDFASRKGRRYMCGVVDSDTGKPLAVFGSRYGQEIREWLSQHQEISTISRDGSHAYAELVRESLPDAIQISDRFHLVKNLKDTMVDIIKSMLHRKKSFPGYPYPTEDEAYNTIQEDILQMGEEKHRMKVRRYYQVRQLQGEGKSFSQICEVTGLKPTMVYNYSKIHIRKILTRDQILALDAAREMARVISGGIITKDAISRRLGGRLPSRLVHRCTDTICRRYEEKRKAVREQRKSLELKGELKTIRKDSIWKYIHSGQTSSKALQAISITNPDVSRIIDSCKEFCRMIHHEKGSLSVEQWIKIARLCNCRKLNGFVDYIESDIEAVIQACTSVYNNGFMEGSVNKFKAIKRSMYNRANIVLLRAKILYGN